ncbi:MAG: hypothetical protein LUF85_13760 [Bacteroides sp.]|nr:hypothetical protein [Bacteroides sp.]
MTFAELVEAYFHCRQNKRYTDEALAFEVDCERNLEKLYDELSTGTYEIGFSKVFIVDKPVKREIFAAAFRDRILHHWLFMKLNPLFEREFIHDTYGCRKGRGTLFGIGRVKRFIARCSKGYTEDCYILRCDIRGFFMNIDRNILAVKLDNFIRQKYQGEDLELVRRLARQVVMVNPVEGCSVNSRRTKWNGLPRDKSIFTTNGYTMPNGMRSLFDEENREKGIPIGNLTSQMFANFYLNGLDHFVKHTLGVKYYGRYMDDFVMVHPSKEFLQEVKRKCAEYLERELMAQLHPSKVYLQHYSKGVEFVGAYIRYGAVFPGKKIKSNTWLTINRYNELARERRLSPEEIQSFQQSMNSYLGIMIHYNSYKVRKKMLGKVSGWIANDIKYAGYNKVIWTKKVKKKPVLWDPYGIFT